MLRYLLCGLAVVAGLAVASADPIAFGIADLRGLQFQYLHATRPASRQLAIRMMLARAATLPPDKIPEDLRNFLRDLKAATTTI